MSGTASRNPPPGRRTGGRALYRLVGLAALLGAWAFVAHGAGPLVPSPARVAAFAWREILDGELPRHLAATLARAAAAFVLAMSVGSTLGYAMGRSPRLDAVADPWLIVALNLPLLLVAILAYIWVGLNEAAAVLAVVVAKAPAVIVTVREGARALDPGLDAMAAVFRVPPLRRLRAVVLPQLAPYLSAASRGGLAITWKIVLVVELLGRPNGIGFALNTFFQNFDVTGIMAYGLVFAVAMLLVEAAVLQPLERRANRWRADA